MNTSLYTIVDQARKPARPFVKWAGGKGQLLWQLKPYLPPTFNRYYEPFVGGGALFFYLQPEDALLSDLNPDLINAYKVVRDNVEKLIKILKGHKNEKEYYYQIRSTNPSSLSDIEQAARFIYLNKTCYNGLYRVNSRGQFNVPFGKYLNPLICDKEGLRVANEVLSSTELLTADFEVALENAEYQDFIYLDPPYDPLSQTSSFTSYTKSGFGESEQKRLANTFKKLSKRGSYILLNNSDTDFIRNLYSEFHISVVSAKRAINSKGDGRGAISELVITNYVPESFHE